jgi:hypothetical protein
MAPPGEPPSKTSAGCPGDEGWRLLREAEEEAEAIEAEDERSFLDAEMAGLWMRP